MGHVNDYVVSGEHSAYILAHAAVSHEMMDVFGELMTWGKGTHSNAFHRFPIPVIWLERDVAEVLQTARWHDQPRAAHIC